MLRGIENMNLSFINRAAQARVEQDYHRNLHREIGTTPLQRMLDGPNAGRRMPIPCAWPLPANSSALLAEVISPLWPRASATSCRRDLLTCTRFLCSRPAGTRARRSWWTPNRRPPDTSSASGQNQKRLRPALNDQATGNCRSY